jgi:hypothetical protein
MMNETDGERQQLLYELLLVDDLNTVLTEEV